MPSPVIVMSIMFVIVILGYSNKISEACTVGISQYDWHIRKAVEKHWTGKYREDWCWYKKQLIAESNLRPNICSVKGACGIAQFMPHIAKAYRIDPMDPLESIDAGANLMSDLISRFHRDDKMCTLRMSWASYQWGYGNVRRAIKRTGNPCWHNGIKNHAPPSTRHYVWKIENL